ncbi:DNA gyrase inhibitor YacG [Rhizobium sp. EC-SD404]|uniref:DNA gyrase inhibitor YacG n=1 Tax=Rhizobium sp. EC-SD404 TaxID=2038389 RepID=UPI00125A8141|nr:DNA gyrase inhibitor YacG [Rhizobium sp. EC-SD404]VVT32482.1 DNA gyrase inhibitor YacG [Rhizobium sp. EC-SD404]
MVDGIDAKVTPLRKPRPCPECGKPSHRATFPFCSTRCKEIDLNRWLTGAYVIPVREDDPEEGDGSLPDDDQTGRE